MSERWDLGPGYAKRSFQLRSTRIGRIHSEVLVDMTSAPSGLSSFDPTMRGLYAEGNRRIYGRCGAGHGPRRRSECRGAEVRGQAGRSRCGALPAWPRATSDRNTESGERSPCGIAINEFHGDRLL